MKLSRVLLVIALLISSPIVCADYLSFKGLDFSMSRDFMAKHLESEGYKCGVGENSWGGEAFKCEINDAWIIIQPTTGAPERLVFNCQAINACELNFREVAKAISDKYGIVMRWEQASGGMSSFCGIDSGTKVCVSGSSAGILGAVIMQKVGELDF